MSLYFYILLNRIQSRNIMGKNVYFEIMKKAYRMIISLSRKYVPHIEPFITERAGVHRTAGGVEGCMAGKCSHVVCC